MLLRQKHFSNHLELITLQIFRGGFNKKEEFASLFFLLYLVIKHFL
tara:strand:- start:345 stop:482 length:138 start_codon:yes stop_codon:yes gene_type:complete